MLNKQQVSKLILIGLMASFLSNTSTASDAQADRLIEGKNLAFDRSKGNCLACHMIAHGDLPGNTAPPMIAMKARFPDFKILVQQIANPLERNPNTLMPPFGLHGILTDDEINKVAEYLYTL